MKRFYCPKCAKVRRSNKVKQAAEFREHVTVAGTKIQVPVQPCFRHKEGVRN